MEAESTDDILGPKKLNYEFLLLVRDKKYAEALTLGRKILQSNPDNPSVQKFCNFIQKNHSEIVKMVEREKEEEAYESVDSDEQGEEEEEEGEGQENEGDEKQQQSEKSDEDEEQDEGQQEQEAPKEKKQKIELTTCTLNQIPHICPRHHREKKQQTQSTVATQSSSVKKEQ